MYMKQLILKIESFWHIWYKFYIIFYYFIEHTLKKHASKNNSNAIVMYFKEACKLTLKNK